MISLIRFSLRKAQTMEKLVMKDSKGLLIVANANPPKALIKNQALYNSIL